MQPVLFASLLRALSDGTTVTSPPPSPGLKKFQIAEYRYGREEMLALYDQANCQKPDRLLEFGDIALENSQQPLALSPLNDEEQRCWSSSVNSDIVLRLANRGSAPVVPAISRPGGIGVTRGGLVDRGRGRGRGSFYSRNIGDEPNPPDLKDALTRSGRSFDRSTSLTDRNQSWDDKRIEEHISDKAKPSNKSKYLFLNGECFIIMLEVINFCLYRERKFNKDFNLRVGEENGLGSTRKEFRPTDNWRSDRPEREEGDEDSGWRNSKTKGDKWRK
ncbi:GRB10-interacting GYF protein 1 [Nymphon striatum]|nr:GRB10-interacting GYF protein 1 [Nymphon striatum]KAG1714711.1 GRB10-interacting GYF protein 1 [Nymphon striatum]